MKKVITIGIVLVLLCVGFVLWQSHQLKIAHSTFENYAAFRGCKQITSQTDTEGTCVTNSGENIKIVKFDNRWFLDGDLPVCAFKIGSWCPFNWP